MKRSAILLHTSVLLLLVVCIADCLFLKDKEHRQKRGFRMNAASRVAHGYGKRGGYAGLFDHHSPSSSSSSSSSSSDLKQDLSDFLDTEEDSGTVLTTRDFARLLQLNDELAGVIVRKFIDINDDDIISTDELFRRVRK